MLQRKHQVLGSEPSFVTNTGPGGSHVLACKLGAMIITTRLLCQSGEIYKALGSKTRAPRMAGIVILWSLVEFIVLALSCQDHDRPLGFLRSHLREVLSV